jgi:hypothetical protein
MIYSGSRTNLGSELGDIFVPFVPISGLPRASRSFTSDSPSVKSLIATRYYSRIYTTETRADRRLEMTYRPYLRSVMRVPRTLAHDNFSNVIMIPFLENEYKLIHTNLSLLIQRSIISYSFINTEYDFILKIYYQVSYFHSMNLYFIILLSYFIVL